MNPVPLFVDDQKEKIIKEKTNYNMIIYYLYR